MGQLNEWLSNTDNLMLLLYIIAGAFLLIFILGATNTVVVYKDNADFAWSLGIVIVPMVAMIALVFATPDKRPPDYDLFWGSENSQFIASAGIALTLICIGKVFVNSINANGFFVGTLIGLFKIIASVVTALFFMGLYSRAMNKGAGRNNMIVVLLFFSECRVMCT